jgi:hypothetical protein
MQWWWSPVDVVVGDEPVMDRLGWGNGLRQGFWSSAATRLDLGQRADP